jgi:transposase
MRPMGTRLQLEKRRQKAIEMLQAGKTYRFIAKTLKCSTSSVVRWNQTFNQKGIKGLISKPILGVTSKLTKEQKKELFNDLTKGACKFGYTSEIWTLKRISDHIQKKFKVLYRFTSIWKILNKENWSCQKPEKRAIQRNEKVIEDWKQKVWVNIKKNKKN